jgi:hypothetical protein
VNHRWDRSIHPGHKLKTSELGARAKHPGGVGRANFKVQHSSVFRAEDFRTKDHCFPNWGEIRTEGLLLRGPKFSSVRRLKSSTILSHIGLFSWDHDAAPRAIKALIPGSRILQTIQLKAIIDMALTANAAHLSLRGKRALSKARPTTLCIK